MAGSSESLESLGAPPPAEQPFGRLAPWLDPRHLEAGALQDYREAFRSHPARLLVVSSVLRAEIAERLGEFLLSGAVFLPSFGLYSANGPVPEESWQAAEDADRFFRFTVCRDAHVQRLVEEGWQTYFGFRRLIRSSAINPFFEAVTGLRLGVPSEPNVIAMRNGDFLRRHTDLGGGRRLAFVFYLSQEWQPSFGGALHVVGRDGQVTRIEAAPNRLVLFDVTAHQEHFVAPIEAAAGERARLTVSGWVTDPEQEAA